MENVLNLIDDDLIKAVLAGSPLDIDKVQNKKALVSVAVHCCINGPVGVHQKTTFPSVDGEVSIDSVVGYRINNSTWRNFCTLVAKKLPDNIPCNTLRNNGGYWPLKDMPNKK